MAKTTFEITMVRPDRKRKVNRILIADNVRVASEAQLFGFVTHSVFKDSERGPEGTVYTMKVTPEGRPSRVTTMRKERGRYKTI